MDTKLHKETGSTHSAFLLTRNQENEWDIRFEAEDIGRHNAIDKVVGYALLNGIPLTEAALFTSGRVPVDVAVKVIRAGIPILISKEKPTAEAVALAGQYNLTLICKARKDSFEIYHDALGH